MGLEPKLTYKINDCNSITINEVIGFYNSVTNTKGWGSPNLARNFTGTAVITITNSINDSMEEIDVKSVIEAAVFPEYVIATYTPEALVDGLYYVTLTMIDEEDPGYTYQAQVIIPVYCNVECCVHKKAAKIAEELCNQNCNSDVYISSDIVITYYNSLCLIAECLGEQDFLKILKQLQKLCNQYHDDCGCGCGGC